MSCFRKNESNDRDILEFTDNFEFAAQNRIIHRYCQAAFCLLAMTLNVLLFVVIHRNPIKGMKIRNLLACNTIVDFSYVALIFISGNFSFMGYFRIVSLNDGFINISNPLVVQILSLLQTASLTATWHVIVAQFIYRLLLVKYNEKPYGRRLAFFILFSVSFCALQTVSAMIAFSSDMTSEDREDTIVILKQYGYEIPPENLHGTVFKHNKSQGMAVNLLQSCLLVSYLTVFYCAWSIRRHVSRSTVSISVTTRRLKKSMDRTIFSMGFIAIISNVIPSFITPSLVVGCHFNAMSQLLHATGYASSTLLNPLITLLFIRPYRQGMYEIVTFSYWEKETKNTKQITVVSTNV